MEDIEKVLKGTLDKIAKEQEYNDHKIELSPITSEGANYTSQLFVATLSAPGKDDCKLFAKVAIIGEHFRTLVPIFQTEILFYSKVLPKYKAIEEIYNIPRTDRLNTPKYFGGSTENMKETLVLEELSQKGYEAFNRFKYYDWEYASNCVSVIARFHALSIRFEKDYPEEFEYFLKKVQFSISMEVAKKIMTSPVVHLLESMEGENTTRLEKYYKEYTKDEVFVNFHNAKRKVALIHSDFRPSNIMQKRVENGELDVVLADYQLINKGNPVLDLLFFLICGSDEDFRGKYLYKYFDHYYEEFAKTLRILELNPEEVYRKEDFDADVKELLPFGILFAALFLPIITVDVDQAPKPKDGIDLDDLAVRLSDQFWVRFQGLLRDYVKLGIL